MEKKDEITMSCRDEIWPVSTVSNLIDCSGSRTFYFFFFQRAPYFPSKPSLKTFIDSQVKRKKKQKKKKKKVYLKWNFWELFFNEKKKIIWNKSGLDEWNLFYWDE